MVEKKVAQKKSPTYRLGDSSSSSSDSDREIPLEAIKARFSAGRDRQKKLSSGLGFQDNDDACIDDNINMIDTRVKGNRKRRRYTSARFEDDIYDDEMNDACFLGEDPGDLLDEEYDDFNNMGEDSSGGENEAGGLAFEELIRGSSGSGRTPPPMEIDDDDMETFDGFGASLD